jgi:hypothetical protein
MPCDVACGASATLYVRVLDKKVHSHLCDEHGAQAIAAYHAAGLNVEAQLLAERVFSINAHRDQKKEQVERFLEKLGKPLTDRRGLPGVRARGSRARTVPPLQRGADRREHASASRVLRRLPGDRVRRV